MGLAAGSAAFGHFGAPRPSRVLCAACGRFFAAQRPSPGERVQCSHCSETVEVGAPVVRKGRRHSSRTSIASWADEPRSATAEAVGRVAVCAALVAVVVFLIASQSDAASSSGDAPDSSALHEARFNDAFFGSTADY